VVAGGLSRGYLVSGRIFETAERTRPSNSIGGEMVLERIADLPRFSLTRRKPGVIVLADRARDAQQWELAGQLYRKALNRDPHNAPIWVQYGHALKESGELRNPDTLARAEAAYRRAMLLSPSVADTHLQLGHVLKLKGNTEAAQAAYMRAFALDPETPHPADELRGLGWSVVQLSELRTLLGRADTEIPYTASANESDPALKPWKSRELRARLEDCGLFDPEVYLSLNEDVRNAGVDPWEHFLKSGLCEARHFTNPATVARLLAQMDLELREARASFATAAKQTLTGAANSEIAALFRQRNIRIGVFWNSEGNFFIREIADLLVWALRAEGIETFLRDENASKGERFDLRVFVAPHEFYFLGEGGAWKDLAGTPNTVLYNTEQVQTHWFCLAFPFLLKAPLVLDINFQTAEILRRADCNVVHFMPGHLPTAPYTQAYVDVSEIELIKGYSFARQRYNWLEINNIDDRPIDVLFIGSHAPRRDKALSRLGGLSDTFRFVCIYTPQEVPLREQSYSTTSTAINCALAQRAKIVLNIHRDWLGYFEWSRMVMQGFWQGACVVSDPSLPSPIFEPGVHYLEDNVRQIGELIRWLLETQEGREKLNATRMTGYDRACGLGSMRVALAPVLNAFKQLLTSG
jgi:tetratricopeptide (TPR) repeat protein